APVPGRRRGHADPEGQAEGDYGKVCRHRGPIVRRREPRRRDRGASGRRGLAGQRPPGGPEPRRCGPAGRRLSPGQRPRQRGDAVMTTLDRPWFQHYPPGVPPSLEYREESLVQPLIRADRKSVVEGTGGERWG